MLHVRYVPYLSVGMLHPYYSDNLSDDFQFVALPSTVAALSAYGLKIRTDSGSLIIAQETDGDGQPTSAVDGLLDLYFVVRLRTDLMNITEGFGTGRYWLSNLAEDGKYQLGLSKNALLSAADQLPPIGPQRQSIHFVPGKWSSITMKRIVPGAGWQSVQVFAIDPSSSGIQVEVPRAGLYLVESQPAGGGAPIVAKQIFSDELAAVPLGWAVLHLQLKPADANLNYSLQLSSRRSAWQYYLIEPKVRPADVSHTPINPNSLSVGYSLPDHSRYPANVSMDLIDPNNYPPSVKDYVASITSDTAIREVYLFQSHDPLAILDGPQPELSISYAGKDWVTRAMVPVRSMINTTINYKL